jgi:hypothetical protein
MCAAYFDLHLVLATFSAYHERDISAPCSHSLPQRINKAVHEKSPSMEVGRVASLLGRAHVWETIIDVLLYFRLYPTQNSASVV